MSVIESFVPALLQSCCNDEPGGERALCKCLIAWRSREDSENYVLSRGLPIFIATIPPLKDNAFFRVWQPLLPRVRAVCARIIGLR